jgi:hypothetical protein
MRIALRLTVALLAVPLPTPAFMRVATRATSESAGPDGSWVQAEPGLARYFADGFLLSHQYLRSASTVSVMQSVSSICEPVGIMARQ